MECQTFCRQNVTLMRMGVSLECAALSALWSAAAWRRFAPPQTSFDLRRIGVEGWSRQAATGQSADKAAHSREASVTGVLFYSGMRKVAALWHRRQSLKARSPPKDRLPLWQVEHAIARVAGKCSAVAGELTCRDCGIPAVNR